MGSAKFKISYSSGEYRENFAENFFVNIVISFHRENVQ